MEFGEVLRRLKREGCNLLVTGEVPVEVSDAATRRLLGAPFEDRRRILAFTNAGVERVSGRLPGGCRPSDRDVTIIEQRDATRSTVAERAGDQGFPVTSVGTDLDDLQEAILAEIEGFADGADGLAPAELRMSVDSLRLLVDEHGVDAVGAFLEPVTASVTEVRGMAHYHMPMRDDAEPVSTLTSPFDARIELRQRDGFAPEQRWHLPGYGLTTEWVGL